MEVAMQEEFLSQQELAIRWALHVQTLTKWRGLRRGPPFVKLGKTVRYAMSDVLEFERDGLRKPIPKLVLELAAPQDNGPQLTVRDLVASLNLGDRNAGAPARKSHSAS
jgi:hypothetical protein